MKKVKNKKALAAVVGLAGVAVVGGVIAYNHDAISFNNLFGLDKQEVVFEEDFVAPTNWQPCEEVDKKVRVTNNNNYPVAVRVKYNEFWREANSQTSASDHQTSDLSMTFDKSGTQSPIVVLTFDNPNDWTLESDGWYYYKQDLAANATTSDFLGSVMMDCDFNLVGDTISYTNNGLTGESQPTAYANADYHLYLVGQTIPAANKDAWRPEPHVANCQDPTNDLLYDKIACATNGLDTNLNFETYSTTTENGFGVNTYAPSVNDQFKTYYFRGRVTDNNVLWADQCWKILRTTETGGVKMVWIGAASNGQCTSTAGANGISIPSNQTGFASSSLYPSFAAAGYMYGNNAQNYKLGDDLNSSSSYYFSNDVTWDGSSYTLTDTDVYGTPSAQWNTSVADHHYTCLDGSTSCTSVAYLWDYGTDSSYTPGYVTFTNGITVENFNSDDLYVNTNDSNAKTHVDSWFTNNIASARRADLEDTIFCNDRSFAWGAFKGKDELSSWHSTISFTEGGSSAIYSARIRDENRTYTLDCSNVNDAFTVSSSNGNGALDYPVGLVTIDELAFAGTLSSNGSYGGNGDFLRDANDDHMVSATMTPAGIDREFSVEGYATNFFYYGNAGSGDSFNPVVSLKFGAKYSGTGTVADPYTISF